MSSKWKVFLLFLDISFFIISFKSFLYSCQKIKTRMIFVQAVCTSRITGTKRVRAKIRTHSFTQLIAQVFYTFRIHPEKESLQFDSSISSHQICTRESKRLLTLTRPISLHPHAPVAQRVAEQCKLIASLVKRLFVRVDWTERLRDDSSTTD